MPRRVEAPTWKKMGAQRVWGPKGCGPKSGGPKGGGLKGGGSKVGGPKFGALFCPSPTSISLFFSLSGVLLVSFFSPGSSRGILLVFEAPGPSNVHVWALRLSCETPAAGRRPPEREREKKKETRRPP